MVVNCAVLEANWLESLGWLAGLAVAQVRVHLCTGILGHVPGLYVQQETQSLPP